MKSLKLFTAFICFVALVSCGTKSTPLPQGPVNDGWIRFGEDSGMVFTMYSKVKMDSTAYIADIATIHIDEMYVDSQKIGCSKSEWVIDAESNDIQENGYIFYDSLGNLVCENADSAYFKFRTLVASGKISSTGVKLAKLLYDNENNLKRCAKPIKVKWGKKEWYKYENKEGCDRYLIVGKKTNSAYMVWYYARVNDFGERFAAHEDNSGIERIVYGVLRKLEIDVDMSKVRTLEAYTVDKYNDVFFDISDKFTQEWEDATEGMIRGVKDYVVKYQ